MNSGVNIIKQKNKLVPVDYLKMVADKNKSCSGVALILPDKPGEFAYWSEEGPADLETLISLQEENKGELILMHFLNSNLGKIITDDQQPYPILRDKDNNPLILALMEGQFRSKYTKKDAKHSPEFLVANTYLYPKLKAMFEAHGGDLSKLEKELRDVNARNDIAGQFGERGTITLFFNNGNMLMYTEEGDEQPKHFSWGHTTNPYDFKETSVVAAPEKKVSWKDKIKGAATTAEKPVTEEKKITAETSAFRVAEKPSGFQNMEAAALGVAPVSSPLKEDIDNAAALLTPGKIVTCPAEVHGNSNIRAWYKTNAGFVPQRYKKRPSVAVEIGKDPLVAEPVKSFSDMPKDVVDKIKTGAAVISQGAGNTTIVRPAVPVGSAIKGKDTTPKHVASTEPVEPITTANDGELAIIDTSEIKGISDTFLKKGFVKRLDRSSEELAEDPNKVFVLESKFPTFEEQTTISIEDFLLSMSREAKQEFVLEYPQATQVLLTEIAGIYYKAKLGKPVAEKPVEAPAAAPVQELSARDKLRAKLKLTKAA